MTAHALETAYTALGGHPWVSERPKPVAPGLGGFAWLGVACVARLWATVGKPTIIPSR
jgi:hypothetical protein